MKIKISRVDDVLVVQRSSPEGPSNLEEKREEEKDNLKKRREEGKEEKEKKERQAID